VGHLERRAAPVDLRTAVRPDVVLISHMHLDHFDPRSLRLVDRRAVVVVSSGAGMAAAKLGFSQVVELAAGESFAAGGAVVTATPAEHGAGRWPWSRHGAIGFTVEGGPRAYFPGDTDLFDGMRDLAGSLDVALLPVWGWGTRLGPGHLDPHRAALALQLLEPRVAVPIHWGTLYPIGLRRFRRPLMTEPPLAFAREAARLAPDVDVRILEPGAGTTL
jgi:L-ascorbate metabolism protein UlaG (beta-lactamase superfamily)